MSWVFNQMNASVQSIKSSGYKSITYGSILMDCGQQIVMHFSISGTLKHPDTHGATNDTC